MNSKTNPTPQDIPITTGRALSDTLIYQTQAQTFEGLSAGAFIMNHSILRQGQ
jgi:hypothetical protein